MRRFLIGPALIGVGWIVGSYYGAEAQQLVRKSPAATYEGVSHALDNVPVKGSSQVEGKPVQYQVRIEREPDRQLIVHLLFGDREGGRAEISFVPRGEDTVITAKAHGDRAVLSDALAGTSKSRLAYAPDWMLNLLTVRPLLQQLAQQIESGQPPSIPGMSEAQWEARLPADQQRQLEAWRQYDASRPSVDPNADAEKYMQGSSN